MNKKRIFLIKTLCCILSVLFTTNVFGDFPASPSFTINVPALRSIAVGDLNNDGKLDIAAISNVKGKENVLVFFQKDNKFPAKADMTINGKAYDIQIADVDMDGKNDIITTGPKKRLNIFIASDNFTKKHDFHSVNQHSKMRGLSVGHLMSEKMVDVLVGPVWRQFSPGLKMKQGYVCGPQKNDNEIPLVCDFNLDGKDDILYTAFRTSGLRLFYGPFSNIRLKPADTADFVVLDTPHAISYTALGDLNGDGRPDIVASTSSRYRKTFIYFQNQPLGFSQNASPTISLRVCGSLAIADFDNNKRADLAIGRLVTGTIKLYLQHKPGVFSSKPKTLKSGLDKCRKLIAKDLNGDAKPDIIVAGSCNKKSLINIFLSK